jgi:hypothetical protein
MRFSDETCLVYDIDLALLRIALSDHWSYGRSRRNDFANGLKATMVGLHKDSNRLAIY